MKLSYYQRNREKVRKQQAEYRQATRAERTNYQREYIKTESGKAAINKAMAKYDEAHPERRKAWDKARAIPAGPCVVCGKPKAHRHHPDPLKPLEVILLCPLHHKQIHNGKLSIGEKPPAKVEAPAINEDNTHG